MVSMCPIVARATDICQKLLSIKQTPKTTLLCQHGLWLCGVHLGQCADLTAKCIGLCIDACAELFCAEGDVYKHKPCALRSRLLLPCQPALPEPAGKKALLGCAYLAKAFGVTLCRCPVGMVCTLRLLIGTVPSPTGISLLTCRLKST